MEYENKSVEELQRDIFMLEMKDRLTDVEYKEIDRIMQEIADRYKESKNG